MKKRLLAVLMLTFLIGGGSLFTLAEGITVPSKTFDLGNGVIGNWNKDTQTLSVEGNGKINLEKWNELKKELDYRNKTLDEIRFTSTVQFPDRAYEFFAYGTTAKIIIPQAMDVSNLTVIDKMFFETSNFHVDELRWNLPNLTSALSAFNGTTNFKGKVYFTNLNKLKNGAGLFA